MDNTTEMLAEADDLCKMAEYLSTHVVTMTICIFGAAINLIATIYSFLLLFCLATRPIFHPNLRVVVCNLVAALCLYCGGELVSMLYQIVTSIHGLMTDKHGCYFVMLKGDCAVWQMSEFVAGTVVFQSIFILAAERVWATVCYRTYEHTTPCAFGVLSTLLLWSVSSLFGGNLLLGTMDGVELPYCSSYLIMTFPQPEHPSMTMVYVAVVVDLLQYALFWTLLGWNRRLVHSIKQQPVAAGTLTVKYQVSDNVKMGELINRIVLFHFYVSVCFHISAQALPILLRLSSLPSVAVFELGTTNFALFALYIVWQCARSSSGVRAVVVGGMPTAVRRWVLATQNRAAVAPEVEQYGGRLPTQMEHFTQLRQMWKNAYQRTEQEQEEAIAKKKDSNDAELVTETAV